METEFEAKIPITNKEEIRNKLQSLGAKLVFQEKKFRRIVFNILDHKGDSNKWVRLRDEGDKITLTVKEVKKDNIEGMSEIEIVVDDFEKTRKLLVSIGMIEVRFEENLREEWRLDSTVFEIDTWPEVDPYLEIESINEVEVKKYFQMLGFDYSKAIFGPTDNYYNKFGMTILDKKSVTFDNGIK